MTTVFNFYVAFLLNVSFAYGQAPNLILTQVQNVKWLDSLKTFPLDKQLPIISSRLLTDTNIYFKQSYPDRIKVVEQLGNKVYGEGKPTIIVNGYPMVVDNKTDPMKIVRFADLVTIENIKEVSILSPNDPTSTALYGSAAMNGIIIMTVTKKKHLKKFRRLNLKHNY